MEENEKPILFFDGICNFCNSSVNFLLDIDKRERLYFAPNQGETYAALRQKVALPAEPESIIFWDKSRVFVGSDAVIEILRAIGGVWNIAVISRIIPRFLRDIIYYFIARRRYRWFGKRESCRFPTPNERARFLP